MRNSANQALLYSSLVLIGSASFFGVHSLLQATGVMVQWREQKSLNIQESLQVSPRGFKSNLEIVIDALIKLHLRVTILAKLPHKNSWFEDLKRYGQALVSKPDIYLLSHRALAATDWFTPVLIPESHPMQGEYSFIMLSEAISIMASGHRQEVNLFSDEARSSPDAYEVEEVDTQPKVSFSMTLQRPLIQQKLDEFRQVIQTSLIEHPNQAALKALVSDWGNRLQIPEQCDPAFVDAVFREQAKHQERLRQQARRYRRQAMTASNLSTQNEVLLNTLRLKDDFLNTVGQALRTPLSTIKTALPLLASPNLKASQRQRYLDMISRECDRQSSLINGVLDLLQLEQSLSTVTLDPVKLFDIVPGVVSTYQPIAQEKGIRLAYTVPDTLPLIACPESWVRQIVIHLLNNSIRHTEAGGEVWVTVQVEEEEEYLILNVKDTGTGIPANELPHIFEHFYRGRQPNQEEGAGLGLTIVQQLLLYCDGQISVESQPNMGTHFKVRLPFYRND